MSDLAIFLTGLCLTVAIGGALAVLIRAAIEDGRTQRAMEARSRPDAPRGAAAPVAQRLPAGPSDVAARGPR